MDTLTRAQQIRARRHAIGALPRTTPTHLRVAMAAAALTRKDTTR